MCTYPIDLICIHFLCCVHSNEHIQIHDVICDTFVIIAHDANFHLGQEKFHVFFLNMFNFSHWWINIVVAKDGICTLVDVVIADPMWVDLFPWSYITQNFIAFDMIQAKKWSYCD